ncbi:MAG: UTP-glucose-phosphate uridylyltransferase [Pseudomonadota bacterium]
MTASKRVTKALIPAAGLGTRFLPATKSIPKEMLTIVDSPAIFYVVEEAVLAGIQDIVLIQGRGKAAIEDFFDVSYELEDKLAKDGKTDILERLNRIKGMANIISIRQKQPLGLGHAVLCGQPVIGNEPFAVLLGDEVMVQGHGQDNVTKNLVESFHRTNTSTIAVMPVSDADVSKYGIAEVRSTNPGEFVVNSLVEKPQPNETPSRWALPGRYVFDAKIFNFLETTKPGKNGEIQLTDAMAQMLVEHGMRAIEVKSRRFDAGDPLGFLKANIEMALLHPRLGAEVKAFIKEIAQRV